MLSTDHMEGDAAATAVCGDDPVQEIRGLAEGLALNRTLTPSEQRQVSRLLHRLADEQEAKRRVKARGALDALEAEREQVKSMRRQGALIKDITRELRLSRTTVWWILRDAGLTR